MGERQEQLYLNCSSAPEITAVMGISPMPGIGFVRMKESSPRGVRDIPGCSCPMPELWEGLRGSHPNISHHLGQEKDPTGMRDHLRLGSILDGTEPMVALAELGLGLDSTTSEAFSNLNDSDMELSALQREERDGKRDRVTGMKC